ncbi:transposase [Spirosoma luteolum]
MPLANGKWLYRAVWINLWSGKMVGWYLADHILNTLVIKALRRALLGRRPAEGLILHSDRGGQYASKAFRKLPTGKYKQSMSRASVCYDNATTESFWSRLKTEVPESGVFSVWTMPAPSWATISTTSTMWYVSTTQTLPDGVVDGRAAHYASTSN